jgi:hypothetical protein
LRLLIPPFRSAAIAMAAIGDGVSLGAPAVLDDAIMAARGPEPGLTLAGLPTPAFAGRPRAFALDSAGADIGALTARRAAVVGVARPAAGTSETAARVMGASMAAAIAYRRITVSIEACTWYCGRDNHRVVMVF